MLGRNAVIYGAIFSQGLAKVSWRSAEVYYIFYKMLTSRPPCLSFSPLLQVVGYAFFLCLVCPVIASERASTGDHAEPATPATVPVAESKPAAPADAAVDTTHVSAAVAPVESISAPEALGRLISGNQRFISGDAEHPRQSKARRGALAGGQHPFAIILTCADSRVSPEIIFDQGLGDLFVLRNAGNLADDHVLGSIEYAVEHLHAGLVMVLGHSKCGAVSAAVSGGKVPGHILNIVEDIEPAVEAVADKPGEMVDNAIRANALLVARQISRSKPILSAAVEAGHLKVVAARYDLSTGQVVILP